MKRKYLIAIAGVSACGKSLLARKIVESGVFEKSSILCLDSYYFCGQSNYDVPSAIDWCRLGRDIDLLRRGGAISLGRSGAWHHSEAVSELRWNSLLIVDGLFAGRCKSHFNVTDLFVYVDSNHYLAGARRLCRDVFVYGEDVSDALEYIENVVVDSIRRYILPQRRIADFVYDGEASWTSLVERLREVCNG